MSASSPGNGTLGFVYAEDYLQTAAAPVFLDVTWNGRESSASFVLALTSSSAPTAPANTALPSGITQEGSTLTASEGTWTDTQPISYAYQWRRCDASASSCYIAGQSAQTHLLTSADLGSTMRVQVTASNTAGSASAESAQSAVVVEP